MTISLKALTARAGLVVGVVALGGCASTHNSLGTGSSPCFQALPSATKAVHSKGRLVGVRRVSLSQLRKPLSMPPSSTPGSSTPAPSVPPSSEPRAFPPSTELSNPSNRAVCVVAFQGTYGPGDVEHETVQRSGNYAIVVVGEHGGVPLRSFVTDRLPLRFRHLS
jgi:hypothetical protein